MFIKVMLSCSPSYQLAFITELVAQAVIARDVSAPKLNVIFMFSWTHQGWGTFLSYTYTMSSITSPSYSRTTSSPCSLNDFLYCHNFEQVYTAAFEKFWSTNVFVLLSFYNALERALFVIVKKIYYKWTRFTGLFLTCPVNYFHGSSASVLRTPREE